MQQAPPGAMLAVPLSEKEILPLLNGELSLAAVNAPSLCVVSGTVEAVEALERGLVEKDLICRRLHTSHALHSAMMDRCRQRSPEIQRGEDRHAANSDRFTLTGTWMTAEEACDAGYWTRQLRQTVRFADGLGEILKEPETILLEIGPGQTLSALAKQQAETASCSLRCVIRATVNPMSHTCCILWRVFGRRALRLIGWRCTRANWTADVSRFQHIRSSAGGTGLILPTPLPIPEINSRAEETA